MVVGSTSCSLLLSMRRFIVLFFFFSYSYSNSWCIFSWLHLYIASYFYLVCL